MTEQTKQQAEVQSDVRKNPRRIAFITRRSSPHVRPQDDEFVTDTRVMTYPAALGRFILALEAAFLILVWWSLVATRMKNVLSVKAPRYQVGLNSNARERILTEKRCKSRFCWTASARCRLLVPPPLRKMERQTAEFLMRSNSALIVVVAMLKPSRIPGRLEPWTGPP